MDRIVYQRLASVSEKTGFSAAEIATWCVEDCLKAMENNKAIIPRIVLVLRAIKKGPEFSDPDFKK
jgi:hypothetical protein